MRLVENLSRRRELSSGEEGGPSYTVYAVPENTIRHRAISVDFEPKSAFENDGTYLADEEPKTVEVKDYIHYTDDERDLNDTF